MRFELPMISVLFLLALSVCANAASSEWHDLGGGKARLVLSADPATSSVTGIVEVQLQEGWSTYWRYPGSSGIPPKFDFSTSKGFSVQSLEFPTPQLQSIDDVSYAGYKNSVSFPFYGVGNLSSDMTVSLKMLIGLCREVCIPAIAEISVNGAALLKSDPDARIAISRAQNTLPDKQTTEDVGFSIRRVQDGKYEVGIDYALDDKVEPIMFVEGPEKWRLLPSKRLKHVGSRHWFSVNLSNAPANVTPTSEILKFTFDLGSTGIEITP